MNPTKYLVLSCLFAAGCGNGWDGTWLFRFDANSQTQTGDCAPDEPSTYESFGTEDAFVDLAFTAEGTCVANMDGMILTGTEDGGTITLINVDGYSDETELDKTTTTLTLVRDGGTMTGTFTRLEEQEGASYYGPAESYTCTTSGTYTGERLETDAKEFGAPASTF